MGGGGMWGKGPCCVDRTAEGQQRRVNMEAG